MARVDGNGLGGKRGRRMAIWPLLLKPIGWDPIDSTPQTEFGEQLFVTRTAETDKRPYAQRNSSVSESLADRSFSFHSVSGGNLWNY